MKAKPQITVKDILAVLEKRKTVKGKKIKWKLVDRVAVRAKIERKWFCPITFYCYIKTGEFSFSTELLEIYEAARKCQITKIDITIRVSDGNIYNNRDRALRRKLLQATGLVEQARKNGEKI